MDRHLLLELRRRVIRPRDRRRETWHDREDGLDSRGDWSDGWAVMNQNTGGTAIAHCRSWSIT
jgi:hypothetical protein